jgi:enoyl-CoA hydratase/carnithine racemase
MSFATVEYQVEGPVAWVTLNRPGQLNALNTQMRDDLFEALSAVADDPEVRVAVFTGAGERGFCAGADLTEFGTAPSPVAARRIRQERDLWGLLAYHPKPLIAAIHGFCLGSGLELSLLCDLRVAAEGAVFGLPEVSLGFIPAAGGSQSLPRVVGRAKALELALLAERIDAAEALRIGLVHRVTPLAELRPTAEAWAERIAALPPAAVQAAKQAVLRGLDLPLREGIELESRLNAVVKGKGSVV